MKPRTPLPRRRSRIARKVAPRKRNPARRKQLFESDFGGKEYLALIRSLPCAVCEVVGYTVAAHLTSRGAGGKAEDIAPLCNTRWRKDALGFVLLKAGCHERYDDHDPEIRKHEPRLRREALRRWNEFQSKPISA